MKRRTFLSTSLVSFFCISGFVGERFLSLITHRPERPAGSLATTLSALFSNVDDAKQIGERFLTVHPEKADLRLLLDGAGITAARPTTSIRQILSKQRKQDFSRGDTIVLDGWILAKSEVYICAILVIV